MIPIFKPSYDEREEKAVAKVLQSRWSGLGPKVEEFEEKFAKYVDAKYAVATNSATSALHIALRLIAEGPGEVLVPTLTFASTAHIVAYEGMKPVFCDVHPGSLLINEWDASTRITEQTKALIYVLYSGCHPTVSSMTVKPTYPVIFDCAHACGNTMFDGGGKLCCWSFHAVKNLSCGDGGMLTTDDKDQADRAKRLRWMGISKSTHDREIGGYSWDYTIDELGFKYHMNDLTAAIGLVQLEKMPEMQKKRRSLAWNYIKNLGPLAAQYGLTIPAWSNEFSWHLFVIRTKHRDQLSSYLRMKGIATGVHYRPLHLYKCYKGTPPRLPVAENVWPTLLTLPLFPDLSIKEVDIICEHIKDFFKTTDSGRS